MYHGNDICPDTLLVIN